MNAVDRFVIASAPAAPPAPAPAPARDPQWSPLPSGGRTRPIEPADGSAIALHGSPIGFRATTLAPTEVALRALSADVEARIRRLGEMEERLAEAVEAARRALSDQAEDLRHRALRVQEIEERIRALSVWADAQVRTREAGLAEREQAVAEREARLRTRRWPFRRD